MESGKGKALWRAPGGDDGGGEHRHDTYCFVPAEQGLAGGGARRLLVARRDTRAERLDMDMLRGSTGLHTRRCCMYELGQGEDVGARGPER